MTGAIVLCGFMGCGKTTVGKRLAKEMGRDFLDLDHYIEEKEGMTVSEIFAAYGEEGFRQRESLAAEEAARRGEVVIACGGGTVLRRQNVEAFHENGGTIVLLDVPLAVLQRRLQNDRKRPLLQRPDREAFIAELYAQRAPLYRAAADVAVAGSPSVRVTAERIALLARRGFRRKAHRQGGKRPSRRPTLPKGSTE